MVFKIEWEIFGCEMSSIKIWNAFCAAMNHDLRNSHPFDWVLFRKINSKKPGKVEPVFDIVSICLI